jgi:dTMP kinase
MHNLFFAFDGIDGCGKSTQLELAAQRLSAERRHVVTTREPGGTVIAEAIRSVILSAAHTEMVSECELLLYAAARAQHVREKVKPALQSGAILLCDRFDLATYAYQGFGRNISMPLLKTINEVATGGCAPNRTFFFDISVDSAFKRLATMKKTRDRLESSRRDFFSRVAEGYRILARQDPERVVTLDAEKPIEELAAAVYGKIAELLR